MLLDRAHHELGWPTRETIFDPASVGARAMVEAAREKIQRALERLPSVTAVQVGILPGSGEGTSAPLAVVCDFVSNVPDSVLFEAHRLAWSFCRTNLLVTVEPRLVRAWTCSESPAVDRYGAATRSAARSLRYLVVAEADPEQSAWTEGEAAELHWAELVTGQLFRKHPARFSDRKRAHVMLLRNLREVHKRLKQGQNPLDDRFIHDLLARLIFIQFLFDRKDSEGRAALDASALKGYYRMGWLEEMHTSLAEVLQHPRDTYALFDILDRKFNGDLFGLGQEERERERANVKGEHLQLLARFVEGSSEFRTGQRSLWRSYAFDVIPLDLISSIYEAFVNGGVGVFYTPTHVADHLLDRVLPWDSTEWDIRVLDPACGSGIFLVKAYQRLVHRWRNAHPEEENLKVPDLRLILERNIVGVDIDEEAVRIAAFSLYLAMCDEIDPRHLWAEEEIFPQLRESSLHPIDFFSENRKGIRTRDDAGTYDLVVGNPPFGKKTLGTSESAQAWVHQTGWPVANDDIGTVFIGKAAALVRPGGHISMVQSAPALLYNTAGTAADVQEAIFDGNMRVEGVTVLPPRLSLFRNVKQPACIIQLRNEPADDSPFPYECLKRQWTEKVEIDDKIRFAHDSYSVHWLTPKEVIAEPWVWAALAWGGKRDRALLRRLRDFPNLQELENKRVIKTRRGVERGDKKKAQPELKGRRYLSTPEFPQHSLFKLNANVLPRTDDILIGSKVSTGLAAFELPQLLVKLSWVQAAARFQALRVENEGVICEKTYLSVHGPEEILDAAVVVLNSEVATYFLLLTSGRLAFDRSEPLVRDLKEVPLPLAPPFFLPFPSRHPSPRSGLRSVAQIHERAAELFDLNESERILVEDLVRYTLDDFKGVKGHQTGRRPTDRGDGEEPHLAAYGEAFRRVMHATYGSEGRVRVEVMAEEGARLPVRCVRLVVGPSVEDERKVESLTSPELRLRLNESYRAARDNSDRPISLRSARVYEAFDIGGAAHLAVTHIKPDEVRFWTRSAALGDADAFAADVAVWAAGRPTELHREHAGADE